MRSDPLRITCMTLCQSSPKRTTAAWQNRARHAAIRTPGGAISALLVAGFLLIGANNPVLAQAGNLSEQIVVDTLTGAALFGYDPVAYQIDGRAAKGVPEFEATLEGRVWRFKNAGNRAAFLEKPEAYIPAFGGYDPTAVARGVPVAGAPDVFAVVDGQVFLFRNAGTRNQFLEDAEILTAAQAKWPDVRKRLTP